MPKLTELNAATAVNNADLLALVQGGETKKLTAEQLSRLNWLGTVSATGTYPNLVPTGAIMEAGSNANGEYVKYANGAMICTNKKIATYTNAVRLDVNFSFPAVFAVSPRVVVSASQEDVVNWSNRDCHTYIAGATTTSEVNVSSIYSTGVSTVADATSQNTVEIIAFGRWK